MRVRQLLGGQIYTLVRSRQFYLGFAACVLFVALMLYGFYDYSARKSQEQDVFKYTYRNNSYFNGNVFTLYSLYFAFYLLLPIFVAFQGGYPVAGELRSGTLRVVLVRPVDRTAVLLAKYGGVIFYIVLLLSFFVLLNLAVGRFIVGWGDLYLYPGLLNLVEEPATIATGEALWRYFLVVLLGGWAMLALASFAFMLSSVWDNPHMAIVGAITVYFIFHIVGRVDFFSGLRPYFFTHDMEFWKEVFKPVIPWNTVWHYFFKCGAYTSAFLLAAVIVFRRRDITA
ncbi:MAG: ABC transporter permease [Acidobacteriota bacterium]